MLRPTAARPSPDSTPVARAEPVDHPAAQPDATPLAALRDAPEPPLEGRNLEVYREARGTLVANPREFQRYLAAFRSDAAWKEPMKHMAARDPHPRPRAFALLVLMGYGDAALEGFFRERLAADADWAARRNAAEALGALPALSDESRAALRKAADSDAHPEVRELARLALERHP